MSLDYCRLSGRCLNADSAGCNSINFLFELKNKKIFPIAHWLSKRFLFIHTTVKVTHTQASVDVNINIQNMANIRPHHSRGLLIFGSAFPNRAGVLTVPRLPSMSLVNKMDLFQLHCIMVFLRPEESLGLLLSAAVH